MRRPTFSAIGLVALLVCGVPELPAVPPYGDPDQPYDRLPGTWETYHVKWLKPLAEGTLKVLFIVPFAESREVVELAQRLDLEYTVIMNAGRSAWARGEGGGGGSEPTALVGAEAAAVLEKIASERLSLARAYDAIVIGQVAWDVIPESFRALILAHVQRGTGLTYVCPNRTDPLTDGDEKKGGEPDAETRADELYEALFRTNAAPAAAKALSAALPFDLLPLKRLDSLTDFEKLEPVEKYFSQTHRQVPVCITAAQLGKGRILGLQYFSAELGVRSGNPASLTPDVEYDKTMYDYFHALLARSVRWSTGFDPAFRIRIAVEAPATELREPEDEEQKKYCYEFKTPAIVVERSDLARVRLVFSVSAADAAPWDLQLDYQIRDLERHLLLQGGGPLRVAGEAAATYAVPLPLLPRGNYLIDLRVLDGERRVVDFTSRSFRVESRLHVVSIATRADRCAPGQVIAGAVTFSAPLSDAQRAEVRARDTWERTVAKVPVALHADRRGGTFTLPVENPLSGVWDLFCHVTDATGDVASARTWIGIPRPDFDDFIVNMTFCEGPDSGRWKGSMAAERLREFGVNSYLSAILYQPRHPGMMIERHNMRNLYFGDHIGQTGNPRAMRGPFDVEFTESCMSELSRIYRHVADTGELPDDESFPYRFNSGAWDLTADHIRGQITRKFMPSGKFGSPFYILTGESYQSGEFQAQENGCFCSLCTGRFQDWCREEYGNDLKALNAEWNTDLTTWDQVRGILMMDAVERDQLPRWVDFRYFMRSRVWTQFFLDYTDMLRRFVPGARTGRIGHMQYDYTRFRSHMTCSKVYQAQDGNPELHTMVEPELLTSFSDDSSVLIGSCGLINWNAQFRAQRTRQRWPWKMLFMGLRGYDMERHLTGNRLGGESWTTPCMSERMPFFADMSDQVMFLQRGVARLLFAAKPHRAKVAVLWSPRNHFISRLDPFQDNSFSGGWLYNIDVELGAPHDCLALLKSIRIRGRIVAPDDVIGGALARENYTALFLPYSKGLSRAEAEAMRRFVAGGGLLLADNQPGIYSEHGRKLGESRLSDLFPITDRKHVLAYGKGHTAYLHNEMNGYMARMESGDYTGSDTVATLLENYAGITTPVELLHDGGTPRRDTIMPVYRKGSATYFGLLRHEGSRDDAPTTVKLERKHHIWNVREQTYLGHADRVRLELDMTPGLFALLPVRPRGMALAPERATVRQGGALAVTGTVGFEGVAAEAATVGQVAHVRAFAPDGTELEWYRDNVVFEGAEFRVVLPISYSEAPGVYSLVAEHTVTGMQAETTFEVVE